MERWTHEEFCELHRALGEPPQEAFAEWLELGARSVQRWLSEPGKPPSVAVSRQLDGKLRQAVRQRIRWMPDDHVDTMQRRDLLRLLAAAAALPVGEAQRLLWNAQLPRISSAALDSLEGITTVLAGKFNIGPPVTLLGSAVGHLEEASGLLRTAVMKPNQRERLESIVADAALFVGALSMHSGKFAQADAHLQLAEKMAQQAGDMIVLAGTYAQQSLLQYYSQGPQRARGNPKDRIDLLEQADQLADRYAPGVMQMAINAWLAEDRAEAREGYGADHAFERSTLALLRAQAEGPVGKGFCSSAGAYSGWDEARLQALRGGVEVVLGRETALDTITASLHRTTNPRWRASGFVDLAIALIVQRQPEEACRRLTQAYTIGLTQGSATTLHHVLAARALMPPEWNSLKCVRELDDLLRAG